MKSKIYQTLKAKLTWKRVLIASFACIALVVTVFGIIAGCEYLHYKTRGNYYGLEKSVSEHITMVHGCKAGYYFCQLKDKRTGEYTSPKLNHVFVNEYTDDSLVVFRSFDRKHRGYINIKTGRIIIPAQYDRAWNFSEGLAAVIKEGEISFINEQGRQAFPETFPFPFDDSHADYAFQFHNGLCVMITWDHKWGLINTRGEWVVEPIYTEINKPQLGYRIVSDGSHYALLTASGQTILPLEYDVIRLAADNQGFFIAKDGYAKVVDRNLNTIVPFAYDGLCELAYIHGYRTDEVYDKYGNLVQHSPEFWRYDVGMGSGVIDRQGHVIIPAKYFMVHRVDENLFEVEVTSCGERILFDRKGRPVGQANF